MKESQLVKDGIPTFYVSENMYGDKIHIRCCTHRMSEKDIPVWCKNTDDAQKLMQIIDKL